MLNLSVDSAQNALATGCDRSTSLVCGAIVVISLANVEKNERNRREGNIQDKLENGSKYSQ